MADSYEIHWFGEDDGNIIGNGWDFLTQYNDNVIIGASGDSPMLFFGHKDTGLSFEDLKGQCNKPERNKNSYHSGKSNNGNGNGKKIKMFRAKGVEETPIYMDQGTIFIGGCFIKSIHTPHLKNMYEYINNQAKEVLDKYTTTKTIRGYNMENQSGDIFVLRIQDYGDKFVFHCGVYISPEPKHKNVIKKNKCYGGKIGKITEDVSAKSLFQELAESFIPYGCIYNENVDQQTIDFFKNINNDKEIHLIKYGEEL